ERTIALVVNVGDTVRRLPRADGCIPDRDDTERCLRCSVDDAQAGRPGVGDKRPRPLLVERDLGGPAFYVELEARLERGRVENEQMPIVLRGPDLGFIRRIECIVIGGWQVTGSDCGTGLCVKNYDRALRIGVLVAGVSTAQIDAGRGEYQFA